MPRIVRLFALVLSMFGVAPAVGAQVIETPVPFDSAGRVLVLTPAIASRLGLAPPAFTVSGNFTEARLYASSAGGHMLVVQRPSGVVERYALADADVASLRTMVARSLASGASPSGTDLPSEPAARAFTRNQFLLGFLFYGPNLAALANDVKTGTVLYLIGPAATYFGVTALTRNNTITRAQNHLATDGAFRGWAAANGLLTALAGDRPDRKSFAGVGLAGAIGGVLGGLSYGRGLTDAEAASTTTMSTLAALTAGGLLGATTTLEGEDAERVAIGTLVGAGTAGYLAGRAYPRRAKYRVTPGDVSTLWIGAALGTAAVMTPIVDADIEPKAGFAVATAGMLGGTLIADRLLVRRFDHSTSDATMLYLGTIAGGLVGAAGIVLVEPSDVGPALGMVTVGAAAGAIATHKLLRVAPGGMRTARLGGVEMEIDASAMALAASGVRGTHPILRVKF